VCGAEDAGGFAGTAGVAGRNGEALEGVGDVQVCLDFGAARERVVCGALGLIGLTAAPPSPAVPPVTPTGAWPAVGPPVVPEGRRGVLGNGYTITVDPAGPPPS
jgi:hypothetical protein